MLIRNYTNRIIFILILIIKNFLNNSKIFINCKKAIFYKEMQSFDTDLNETSIILKIDDDKMVATTDDNSLRIYDLKNDFQLLKTFSGHHSIITSLIKLKNGDFASASWDKTIKIWDRTNNYYLKKIIEDDSEISSLLETNTGLFISGYGNGVIKLWISIKEFLNYTEHSAAVTCMAVLKNGYLATGSKDNRIIIWDPSNNFSVVKYITGHASIIQSITQLNNGMIASSSDDSTIKIWNPDDDYALVNTLINHEKSVNSIVHLDNELIASGSSDNMINIWNTKNYSLIKSINSGDVEVTQLCYLQNKLLASAHSDGSIKIWNINEEYILKKKIVVDSISLTSMITLFDSYLVSGYSDGRIIVYDAHQNFSLLHESIAHTEAVISLLQIDNGMVLSGSKDKSIKIWNPYDKFALLETLRDSSDGANYLTQLNSGYVISAYNDSSIKIWKPDPVIMQSGHENRITDLKLLNNSLLLSSSLDKKINVHNLNGNNKLIKTLTGHTGEVNKLEILYNHLFASASSDKNIKIWNQDNYKLLKTLNYHKNSITSLLKLSNGVLLSGGNETRIKAWDIDEAFQEIQTIDERTGLFLEVNEEKIITISDESRKVKIYKATPVKHFYKHQENLFILNEYKDSSRNATSILFESISECNSKIFVESDDVNLNKFYNINTQFIYKGYCPSNKEQIKFSYYNEKNLVKEEILTIFFENTPYLWQPISIIGEISKEYSIDFSDKIYDDVFSITSLKIEFPRLPRFGNLISDDMEKIQVNKPYQKLNFEYVSTIHSKLDLFDSFEFRIINDYNLKSEVYTVEITLTPHDNFWSKPKMIIAIICSVISFIILFCLIVYRCKIKKYCCWKEKILKTENFNNTILIDSLA